MTQPITPTDRGWRPIERYAYVERSFEDVWAWLAGHISTLGDRLPDGARSVELRIRPVGVEVSRPVRVHVTGLVCGDNRARAGLAWVDAARPKLFPQFEGVLEIAPVPNRSQPFTQIGIVARYLPPLGPLGAVGDRLVGADVTDSAMTAFLDDLATAVEANVDPAAGPRQQSDAAGGEPDAAPGERFYLALDGLAVRHGGAVGVSEALAATPGVISVSLDPFTGLVAIEHDPDRCGPRQMIAVLDEQAAPVNPAL